MCECNGCDLCLFVVQCVMLCDAFVMCDCACESPIDNMCFCVLFVMYCVLSFVCAVCVFVCVC